MGTAKIDGEWIRCSKCKHKLGKMVGKWEQYKSMPAIEIKCHSCKAINYIMIGMNKSNKQKQDESIAELEELRLLSKGVDYDIK